MQALQGLLWSLVFLVIATGALARIVGWRSLEVLAGRVAVAVVLALFSLPLVGHEVRAVREGMPSNTPTCEMPHVVVVRPEHLGGVALVILGHVALGLWILRRRARGDEQRHLLQQREADRRRERGRMPPRDLDGGAS